MGIRFRGKVRNGLGFCGQASQEFSHLSSGSLLQLFHNFAFALKEIGVLINLAKTGS